MTTDLHGQLPPYAELHCLTNFSFLRGASHAGELVERAKALGYSALAITDECSLAGVVRAHTAAKEQGLPLLVGSEFAVDAPTPFRLVVLAQSRKGYGRLCAFITRLRMPQVPVPRGLPLFEEPLLEPDVDADDHDDEPVPRKGSYRLRWSELDPARLADCTVLAVPDRRASFEAVWSLARWVHAHWPHHGWLAVELLHGLDDAAWLHKLREVQRLTGTPLVAAGDVHMHVRSRKPLQDVMTAARLNCTVAECGDRLQPNAEQHLRSRLRLAQRYPADLMRATLDVAATCHFSLDELSYEYPEEVVPHGHDAASWLRHLTYEGALQRRYPQGLPDKVRQQIETELQTISEMGYEKYFLTVHDIVRYAREAKILCQGRGSAANSAVCYCLGITEVNPADTKLLFGRFISKERNEPPDIDVDFEHQRREDVIQYLYAKYGRHRTALAATVISYRTRSAVREVGKALGFPGDTVDALAKSHQWWDSPQLLAERLRDIGLSFEDPAVQQWLELALALMGMPRHLSQHVGGFVIARGALSEMVPIENAAMEGRSVIQWDKDDLEALRLMKVDVLALGMLSAIRRSLDFMSELRGHRVLMQHIPREDPVTYAMIQRADTVGVFQIESRAQMSMLPRLKPCRFYDLVVQVAIVRPGPIQGGMVHPFLTSRETGQAVQYPPELKEALERTNGVPIFQEQVMQIVMIGAGFTAGRADALRRAMAAWKRKGGLQSFHDEIVDGMTRRGYERPYAEGIFEMIKGFGEYGFPESHAASFAWLAYVSSWIKCHEPAAFLAGLLNSQPMGFYSPSQLVQDARRHRVEVLPVDVAHSAVESDLARGSAPSTALMTPLENMHVDLAPAPASRTAVRLGLNRISGLSKAVAERIVAARAQRPFDSVEDLARRARLDAGDLRRLASADALQSLAGHRRQQVWDASALRAMPALLQDTRFNEDRLLLPEAPEGEEIVFDYASTGLTLRSHPLALLRPLLQRHRYASSQALRDMADGRFVRTCGIVTVRQQPETAKGTIFVSLEDEAGAVNVIIWKGLRVKQRQAVLQSRLMAVKGLWQNKNGVQHLVAQHVEDRSDWLGRLRTESRDFR